ncbi:yccE [Escherichia coli]|uniref:YccE n=1 Tax=Escherichia coli TaxID=562 RepID=A0A376THF6_ECOLX|nr:yccE [Escherichia coli]
MMFTSLLNFFAQAYKLKNKEMNAQLDYLNRYAI